MDKRLPTNAPSKPPVASMESQPEHDAALPQVMGYCDQWGGQGEYLGHGFDLIGIGEA